MRLWHYDLIKKLPRQQLLGQHRECCALRGKGWGKKHSTVNYVFKYPYMTLFNYHRMIMDEMTDRGYKVSTKWLYHQYRGKEIGFDYSEFTALNLEGDLIYSEHDEYYYKECIDNLRSKGINIA